MESEVKDLKEKIQLHNQTTNATHQDLEHQISKLKLELENEINNKEKALTAKSKLFEELKKMDEEMDMLKSALTKEKPQVSHFNHIK